MFGKHTEARDFQCVPKMGGKTEKEEWKGQRKEGREGAMEEEGN